MSACTEDNPTQLADAEIVGLVVRCKTCSQCKIDKILSEFTLRPERNNTPHPKCKVCRNSNNKSYKLKNPDVAKAQRKKSYDKYRDKIVATKKAKDYEYRYGGDLDRRKRLLDYSNTYRRKRRETDSLFKLKGAIATCVRDAYKRRRKSKDGTTEEIIGCNVALLQAHLIGTALKTYGFWTDCEKYHIDHIIPISRANTLEDVRNLNHYKNLQLLSPADNLAKSNKYEG